MTRSLGHSLDGGPARAWASGHSRSAIVTVAVLLAAHGAASADPAAQPAGHPTTAEARVLTMTGDLMARQQVRVFSRAAGLVKRILFREGSIVRANDVIAEIDPEEYELAVREATAAVAMAESRLAAMDAGGRPEERARAAAEVTSAESVLRTEKSNFTRQTGLFTKGPIPRHSLDIAGRELDVAESRVISARKTLALVSEGPRVEDKQIARAEVDRA
ncbi:MAG: biotin/lipoyl-binding protein, partial [Candidatus Riflebacteria bacterium]|nr:biotin/lipoyl-binding protein [Candidatus Riflebacteria bacterium]